MILRTTAIIGLFLLSLSFNSCTEEKVVSDDYLVFGSFYGMCAGEQCVELFKITEDELLEDVRDEYPQTAEIYVGQYHTQLSNTLFEAVKDLRNDFPEGLFDETESTFGCPDCYDQGGYYIEYRKGELHQRWIIDHNLDDVPAYMHDFCEKVSDKIALING